MQIYSQLRITIWRGDSKFGATGIPLYGSGLPQVCPQRKKYWQLIKCVEANWIKYSKIVNFEGSVLGYYWFFESENVSNVFAWQLIQ